MDVGQDTAGSDGDTTHKLVQFFVVADGQLDVAGDNARFLVVAGGVTGQFQDFGAQVFENRGHVDWGSTSDALGNTALAHVSGNTTDWELQSSLGRAGSALSLFLSASTFTFSRHVEFV